MNSGCQRRGDGDNKKDESEGDSQIEEWREDKDPLGWWKDSESVEENETEKTGHREEQEITNMVGARSCVFSLRGMNRVLIDPETEAIIPALWTQQCYRVRGGGGGLGGGA